MGRNRTQLWGAVFNIPLTFGDGVAVLSSLYTDSVRTMNWIDMNIYKIKSCIIIGCLEIIDY